MFLPFVPHTASHTVGTFYYYSHLAISLQPDFPPFCPRDLVYLGRRNEPCGIRGPATPVTGRTSHTTTATDERRCRRPCWVGLARLGRCDVLAPFSVHHSARTRTTTPLLFTAPTTRPAWRYTISVVLVSGVNCGQRVRRLFLCEPFRH